MNTIFDDGRFRGVHSLEMVEHLQPGELACAFPPKDHLNGAMTTIADLQWCASRASKLFVRSLADAVKLIVATNYERANAWGHGNRARRRFEKLGVVVESDGTVGTVNERGELVLAHGCRVSPRLARRPASMREGADLFLRRLSTHNELTAYYDRRCPGGTWTGD